LPEFSRGQEEKVIYGIDNRNDLYNVSNSNWLKNSRSIAALIPFKSLKDIKGHPDRMKLKMKTMEGSQICDDERFYDQGHAVDCSGFLVGKNQKGPTSLFRRSPVRFALENGGRGLGKRS